MIFQNIGSANLKTLRGIPEDFNFYEIRHLYSVPLLRETVVGLEPALVEPSSYQLYFLTLHSSLLHLRLQKRFCEFSGRDLLFTNSSWDLV
jgi:hypothetical protein